MAQVATIVKVFPESMDHFEDLKQRLQKHFKPLKIGEEEMAFGMKAIILTLILNEDDGSEKIEHEIATFKGVSQAQIDSVDRL
ncbi:Elongation factor 1-beta [Candidatus Gugararchaeum adminiculabundum]|nr:Elongation factor 1-beta [Candidatus Gugararchaeum adminiculabundum]